MPLVRELADGPPGEQPPTISRPVAEQKIHLALGRLGLGFADAANLVDYDPAADTAYWRFNRATGEERIHIGPRVASLDIAGIEVILRHEILHRSMYHAFGERYTDAGLSNLTLDICINRLLFSAYPQAMRAASEALYPAESKTTPIALADCSASPAGLPDKLRELWVRIWQRTGQDGPSLSPSSLYYQLLRIGAGAGLPQSYLDEVYTPTTIPRPSMQSAIDRVLDDLRQRLPRGSGTAAELSTFSVSPVKIGTDAIDEFIQSIRVRTIVNSASRVLKEHFSAGSRIQPYSLFPSRLGLVYRAMGLSSASHLFWNRDVQPLGARMAMGVYIDVSGSMVRYFPLVVSLIEALKEYPLRIRAFDTAVRDVDVAAFVAGAVTGGGGTDFNAPVQDLVDDQDVAAGLLITDGEATLSDEVGMVLRRSRKPMHVLYLRDLPRGRPRPTDTLSRYAASTLEIPPTSLAMA